jgi:hypothetical protein
LRRCEAGFHSETERPTTSARRMESQHIVSCLLARFTERGSGDDIVGLLVGAISGILGCLFSSGGRTDFVRDKSICWGCVCEVLGKSGWVFVEFLGVGGEF